MEGNLNFNLRWKAEAEGFFNHSRENCHKLKLMRDPRRKLFVNACKWRNITRNEHIKSETRRCYTKLCEPCVRLLLPPSKEKKKPKNYLRCRVLKEIITSPDKKILFHHFSRGAEKFAWTALKGKSFYARNDFAIFTYVLVSSFSFSFLAA